MCRKVEIYYKMEDNSDELVSRFNEISDLTIFEHVN